MGDAVRDDDEIPAELLEAILAMSEWDPPPLVAQGTATGIATKGEFPPIEWDY